MHDDSGGVRERSDAWRRHEEEAVRSAKMKKKKKNSLMGKWE